MFNARCIAAGDNDCARAIAQEHGRLMFAGSDAHTTVELGQATVRMPPFDSPESFLAGLRQAEIRARFRSPRRTPLFPLWSAVQRQRSNA